MTEATEKTTIIVYHHAFDETYVQFVNSPKDKPTSDVINKFFEEIIDEEICEGDFYEIYLDDFFTVLHELPLKFNNTVLEEKRTIQWMYEGTKGEEND